MLNSIWKATTIQLLLSVYRMSRCTRCHGPKMASLMPNEPSHRLLWFLTHSYRFSLLFHASLDSCLWLGTLCHGERPRKVVALLRRYVLHDISVHGLSQTSPLRNLPSP